MPSAVTLNLARAALALRGLRSSMIGGGAGRLHALVAKGGGALPTTVVLHGFGSTAAALAPLLLRLRPHVRGLLAPDAPGHGLSPRPAPLTTTTLYEGLSRALLAELSEPVLLCGVSLGGGLALRFAMDHPERVAGVVACSPAGAPLSSGELDELLRVFEVHSAEDAATLFARLVVRVPWYAPALYPVLAQLLSRPEIRELASTLRDAEPLSAERLAALRPPTLVVWGKQERLLPASGRDFFRAHLPRDARLLEPGDLGHSPHFEAPGRLARIILDFARGLRAGP